MAFREPSGTGKWQDYNKYWFTRHACIVSHDPDKLIDEHMNLCVPILKRVKLILNFGFRLLMEYYTLWSQLENSMSWKHYGLDVIIWERTWVRWSH